MTDLKERAIARLDEWLKEDRQRELVAMLEEIQMRADHLEVCECKAPEIDDASRWLCPACEVTLNGGSQRYDYPTSLANAVADVIDHPALFGDVA